MREIDFSKKTIRKQWKLVNEWYADIEDQDLDPEKLIKQISFCCARSYRLSVPSRAVSTASFHPFSKSSLIPA